MSNNVRHIWSVICQKAVIDSGSNTASLLEVLEKLTLTPAAQDKEHIKAGKTVAVSVKFEIVSYWKKITQNKIAREEISVILYSPSKKKLGEGNIKFEIPFDKKGVRTITKFEQLPIDGEGEYMMEVRLKKGEKYTLITEVPFDVEIKN